MAAVVNNATSTKSNGAEFQTLLKCDHNNSRIGGISFFAESSRLAFTVSSQGIYIGTIDAAGNSRANIVRDAFASKYQPFKVECSNIDDNLFAVSFNQSDAVKLYDARTENSSKVIDFQKGAGTKRRGANFRLALNDTYLAVGTTQDIVSIADLRNEKVLLETQFSKENRLNDLGFFNGPRKYLAVAFTEMCTTGEKEKSIGKLGVFSIDEMLVQDVDTGIEQEETRFVDENEDKDSHINGSSSNDTKAEDHEDTNMEVDENEDPANENNRPNKIMEEKQSDIIDEAIISAKVTEEAVPKVVQKNSHKLHEVKRFISHTVGCNQVSFSPCGKMMSTCGDDSYVCLFQTRTLVSFQTLTDITDKIRCASFSHDSKLIAFAGFSSSKLCVNQVVTGEIVKEFNLPFITDAKFHPKLSLLGIAEDAPSIKSKVSVMTYKDDFFGHP